MVRSLLYIFYTDIKTIIGLCAVRKGGSIMMEWLTTLVVVVVGGLLLVALEKRDSARLKKKSE